MSTRFGVLVFEKMSELCFIYCLFVISAIADIVVALCVGVVWSFFV